MLLACGASLAVGAALDILSGELPQRAQELFEACIGLIAAALLTSMVFWMRRAARNIKGELQASVDAALWGARQGPALVGLAFLAVAREGSNQSSSCSPSCSDRFAAVEKTLAKYRAQGGGFETCDKLSEADRKALAAAITTLAEDLARLQGVLGLG